MFKDELRHAMQRQQSKNDTPSASPKPPTPLEAQLNRAFQQSRTLRSAVINRIGL